MKYFLFFLIFVLNPLILISEDEGDSISYKRNLWFYSQRFEPFDSIPPGAMQNALNERDIIRAQGYFLNPSFVWQSIGPAPLFGQYSGRINAIKFADANTLVIGAPNGGIWMCSDFRTSATWVNMDPNNHLKSNTSGAIGIDNSQSPPIIYYGTGEGIYGFFYHYLGNGVYKTTDWGQSWTNITNGMPVGLQIFRIAVRPGEPTDVFAATSNGLYRSTNAGQYWMVVEGTLGLHCNDIVISN